MMSELLALKPLVWPLSCTFPLWLCALRSRCARWQGERGDGVKLRPPATCRLLPPPRGSHRLHGVRVLVVASGSGGV
jgi:hypothetical protein